MALKMALKVNSDLRFEFIGLFPLYKNEFFTPNASYRLFVTFCGNRNRNRNRKKKATCRPAAAGKKVPNLEAPSAAYFYGMRNIAINLENERRGGERSGPRTH